VLDECDGVIEVPTFGAKNSLNVASAGAIVIYEALRQWGHLGASGAPGGRAGAQNVRVHESSTPRVSKLLTDAGRALPPSSTDV